MCPRSFLNGCSGGRRKNPPYHMERVRLNGPQTSDAFVISTISASRFSTVQTNSPLRNNIKMCAVRQFGRIEDPAGPRPSSLLEWADNASPKAPRKRTPAGYRKINKRSNRCLAPEHELIAAGSATTVNEVTQPETVLSV